MEPLGWLGRLHWWFTGEVADQVHDFDGIGDAIGMPLFILALVTSFLYTGVHLIQTDGILVTVAGVVFVFLGSLFVLFNAIVLAASIAYATQETELPAGTPSLQEDS